MAGWHQAGTGRREGDSDDLEMFPGSDSQLLRWNRLARGDRWQWRFAGKLAGRDKLACTRSKGIVMHAHDPAEAVEVLDLLLKFFGDGERWVKGRLSDRRGNRCLVGALDFVNSHHAIQSDAAERYLADEISAAGDCGDAGEDCARFRASLRQALSGGRYRVSEIVLRRDALSDFSDGCKDFSELRALILQARVAAMEDAKPAPVARSRLAIDELVMA